MFQREFFLPSKMALSFNCPIHSGVQIKLGSYILITYPLWVTMSYTFKIPKICSFFSIPTLIQIVPALVSILHTFFLSSHSFDPVFNPQLFLYQAALSVFSGYNWPWIFLASHTCLALKAPGDSYYLSNLPSWALIQEASLSTHSRVHQAHSSLSFLLALLTLSED